MIGGYIGEGGMMDAQQECEYCEKHDKYGGEKERGGIT